MNTKLFTATNWLSSHRVQIQAALVVVVFSLTLIALFTTGTIVRADQIITHP
jgi:hypothetical protein